MYNILFLFILLLFLPSCQRIVNWGKVTFNQGCRIWPSGAQKAREYLRSVKVYDQITTVGTFDALLLTEESIKFYVKLYTNKFNFTDKEKIDLKNKELSKLDNVIAFYVLVWQPSKCGETFEKEDAYWKVRLDTDLGMFLPNKIKKIELPCGYNLIFDKRFNKFQKAYYLEFNRFDSNNTDILKSSGRLTLCFSSLMRKTFLNWSFANGNVIPEVYNSCAQDIDVCNSCCKNFKG